MVSIIVPAYNSELFLERCLHSILEQTYTDFECIVVDDGSEDRSLDIASDFLRLDSRYKVISQNHSGVSASRNKGIESAGGGTSALLMRMML